MGHHQTCLAARACQPGTTGHIHSHRPTIAHGAGPRRVEGPPGLALEIPACAHGNGESSWRCAACAVRAHPASYTSKPRAGGWRLGCWPHHGRPALLTRLATSATAGARPAQAPRALRPVADVRMPVHATILRGRRHLRVALEI